MAKMYKKNHYRSPNGSTPRAGYTNVATGINSASPVELMLSTTQNLMIDSGYQILPNPMPTLSGPMAVDILNTFQVSLSEEKKDFSLIRKQTSKLEIKNSGILDPAISLQKPGLQTADKLGMTMEPANAIFQPDSQLTRMQKKQYTDSKVANRGDVNLTIMAQRFCATQLSINGVPNKYFKSLGASAVGNMDGKGKGSRSTRISKDLYLPGAIRR